MREDPIISGAWIKAALVVLVGGDLGVGAYLLASDVDIKLPDIELDTTAGDHAVRHHAGEHDGRRAGAAAGS
jgi:hypothetical protein